MADTGKGVNCSLTVAGYKTIRLRCVELTYGMGVKTTQSAAKYSSTLYTRKAGTGPVFLTFKMITYQEHAEFTKWIREYGERASEGQLGAILVLVPSRKFSRTMLVSTEDGGPIDQGLQVGQFVWTHRLSFMTATDPLDGASDKISRYIPAEDDTKDAPYFYPAGSQLGGLDAAENVFDVVPSFWNERDDPRPSATSQPSQQAGDRYIDPVTGRRTQFVI